MRIRTALIVAAIFLVTVPAAGASSPIFAFAGDTAVAVDVASTPEGASLVLYAERSGLHARTVTTAGSLGPVIQIASANGYWSDVAYDEQNRRFAVAYPIDGPAPAGPRTALALIDATTGTVSPAGEVARQPFFYAQIERHGAGFLLASPTADGIGVQRLDANLAPAGDAVVIPGSANGHDPAIAADGTGQRVLVAWLSTSPGGSLFAQVLDGTTLAASGPPRALAAQGDAEGVGATTAAAVAWNPKADRWLVGTLPKTHEEVGPEDDFAGSEISRRWAVIGQLVGADLTTTPPVRATKAWQQTDGLWPAVDVAVDPATGIGVVHTAGSFLALLADGTRRRRGRAFGFEPRSGESAAITPVPGTGSFLAVLEGAGRFFGADEDPDVTAPAVTASLPRVRAVPARPRLTLTCDERCDVELRSLRACVGGRTCRSDLRRVRVARRTVNAQRNRHVLTLALTRGQRRGLRRRGRGRACIAIGAVVRDPSSNVAYLDRKLACFGRLRR